MRRLFACLLAYLLACGPHIPTRVWARPTRGIAVKSASVGTGRAVPGAWATYFQSLPVGQSSPLLGSLNAPLHEQRQVEALARVLDLTSLTPNEVLAQATSTRQGRAIQGAVKSHALRLLEEARAKNVEESSAKLGARYAALRDLQDILALLPRSTALNVLDTIGLTRSDLFIKRMQKAKDSIRRLQRSWGQETPQSPQQWQAFHASVKNVLPHTNWKDRMNSLLLSPTLVMSQAAPSEPGRTLV